MDEFSDTLYVKVEVEEEIEDEAVPILHHISSNDFGDSTQEVHSSQCWMEGLNSSDDGFAVELSAYDRNAVEEFPSHIDVDNHVGYHVIDGNIGDSNGNVVVCNTIQDIKGINRKKIQMRRMKYKYECDICHKNYSTPQILRTHKVRHLSRDERPFKCSMKDCEFTAASKIEAERHIRRHQKWLQRKDKKEHFGKTINPGENTNVSNPQAGLPVSHSNDTIIAKDKEVCIEDSTSQCKTKSLRETIATDTNPEESHDSSRLQKSVYISNGHHQTSREPTTKSLQGKSRRKCKDKSYYSVKENCRKMSRDLTEKNVEDSDEKEDQTQLQCGLCGFSCSAEQVLRLHLLIRHHHEQKVAASVVCPICPTTFNTATNLKAHLLSHADEKQFACDECDRRFIMKNRLMAHKRVVHSPKTFKCSYCSKHFSTVHLRLRHERIHTGEKPFCCLYCPFSCNTQGNLVKHVRSQHDRPDYTYKKHQEEIGIAKRPVPAHELETLKQKGEAMASRLLAEIDRPDLNIQTLKEKVNSERQQKEYQNALRRQVYRKRRISNKGESVTRTKASNRHPKVVLPSGGSSSSSDIPQVVKGINPPVPSQTNESEGSSNILCTLTFEDIMIKDIVTGNESRTLYVTPSDPVVNSEKKSVLLPQYIGNKNSDSSVSVCNVKEADQFTGNILKVNPDSEESVACGANSENDAVNTSLHPYMLPDMCLNSFNSYKSHPNVEASDASTVPRAVSSHNIFLGQASLEESCEDDVTCDVTVSKVEPFGMLTEITKDEEDNSQMATFIINTQDDDDDDETDLIGTVVSNIDAGERSRTVNEKILMNLKKLFNGANVSDGEGLDKSVLCGAQESLFKDSNPLYSGNSSSPYSCRQLDYGVELDMNSSPTMRDILEISECPSDGVKSRLQEVSPFEGASSGHEMNASEVLEINYDTTAGECHVLEDGSNNQQLFKADEILRDSNRNFYMCVASEGAKTSGLDEKETKDRSDDEDEVLIFLMSK